MLSTSILSINFSTSSVHLYWMPVWVQAENMFQGYHCEYKWSTSCMSTIVIVAYYIHCEHVWAQALYIYSGCQSLYKHYTSVVNTIVRTSMPSFKCTAVKHVQNFTLSSILTELWFELWIIVIEASRSKCKMALVKNSNQVKHNELQLIGSDSSVVCKC